MYSQFSLTEKQAALFWQKVNKDCPAPAHLPWLGKCWNWTGQTKTPRGKQDCYGRIRMAGKMYHAHRISYALAHGEAPSHLCVLHKCDNPLCVNPDHLWVGTRADNNADMVSKGRDRRCEPDKVWSRVNPERVLRGSDNPKHKLTEDTVRCILAEYAAGGVSQQSLADKHGVNQTLISALVRGRVWRHVTNQKR